MAYRRHRANPRAAHAEYIAFFSFIETMVFSLFV